MTLWAVGGAYLRTLRVHPPPAIENGHVFLKAGFPKREEYPHTPAVFVRVANTGLTAYGKWKCVRKMEARVACGHRARRSFDSLRSLRTTILIG